MKGLLLRLLAPPALVLAAAPALPVEGQKRVGLFLNRELVSLLLGGPCFGTQRTTVRAVLSSLNSPTNVRGGDLHFGQFESAPSFTYRLVDSHA